MAATNYIWDPLSDNVVIEVDDGGDVLAEYTQESGLYGSVVSQNRSGVESHYHYDGQGSVRQLTNSAQTVTDEATYSAFGETVTKTGSTVNPWEYKGAVGYYTNPATEDLYVRARAFGPEIGQWLSRDPVDLILAPYLYCDNSPIEIVDPSGLIALHQAEKSYCEKQDCKKLAGNVRSKSFKRCVEKCASRKANWRPIFDEWLRLDSVGWWTRENIPRCPSRICFAYPGTPVLPSGGQWAKVGSCDWPEENFHPGCVYSMRSVPSRKGATNQCIYDKKGNIISAPPGMGTVDSHHPGGPFTDALVLHMSADVDPVILAAKIDNCWTYETAPPHGRIKSNCVGKAMKEYFVHRPTWFDPKPITCPKPKPVPPRYPLGCAEQNEMDEVA